jgi:hypothetical protein
VVFLAAVALGQALWFALPSRLRVNESGDYAGFYAPVARSLAQGRGPVGESGALATRYPPGYPALLGIVFLVSDRAGVDESSAVRWFHLLCAGVASVSLLRVARRLWTPRTALGVALLWTLYPPAVWLTRQPSSELPFLVALFAAVEALLRAFRHRRRRGLHAFLAGALAGAASLIRPIGLALAALLAVIAWRGTRALCARSRASIACALLLGNLLAILPWEAFVWSRVGRVIPLSTGGPASILDGWTYAANPEKVFTTAHPPPAEVTRFMQDLMARRAEFQSTTHSFGVILEEGLAHPRAAVTLGAIKAARCWYGTDSGRFESATLVIQSTFAALVLMAGFGAWRRGGARRRVARGIATLVGYFWIMTFLTLSIARYMVPAIGLALLLCPHLVDGRRRGKRAGGRGTPPRTLRAPGDRGPMPGPGQAP